MNEDIAKSIQRGAGKSRQKEVLDFLHENPRTFVILDDDPTGTQTVHNVPVITDWEYATLEDQILNSPVFFLLTNSRSLQAQQAKKVAHSIGLLLAELAKEHRKQLIVISRGDSTLRGHYPDEVISLLDGLGWKTSMHVLIPAFFEGGRYTFKDVHYVQEKNEFIPAGETPFAKDSTFGYSSSNLKGYIEEKYDGAVKGEDVLSISIDQLRNDTVIDIEKTLQKTTRAHLIVNATARIDLETFAMASLKCGKNLMYRTAASFVNAITGISSLPLLTKESVLTPNQKCGGLIVIGSYVPKTTEQLNYLKKKNAKALFIKIKVGKMLSNEPDSEYLKNIVKIINNTLASKKDVILYTSRKVHAGTSKEENLAIVNKVSEGLISLVKLVSVRPKYILTKGGITSSDICVKALGAKRALVLGQLLKGVPVWKLGAASKYPEIPLIIFPGNVGKKDDLHNLIKQLQ